LNPLLTQQKLSDETQQKLSYEMTKSLLIRMINVAVIKIKNYPKIKEQKDVENLEILLSNRLKELKEKSETLETVLNRMRTNGKLMDQQQQTEKKPLEQEKPKLLELPKISIQQQRVILPMSQQPKQPIFKILMGENKNSQQSKQQIIDSNPPLVMATGYSRNQTNGEKTKPIFTISKYERQNLDESTQQIIDSNPPLVMPIGYSRNQTNQEEIEHIFKISKYKRQKLDESTQQIIDSVMATGYINQTNEQQMNPNLIKIPISLTTHKKSKATLVMESNPPLPKTDQQNIEEFMDEFLPKTSILKQKKYSDSQENENSLINNYVVQSSPLNTKTVLNNLARSKLLSSMKQSELWESFSVEQLNSMNEENIQNLFNKKRSIAQELLMIKKNQPNNEKNLQDSIEILLAKLEGSFNNNGNDNSNIIGNDNSNIIGNDNVHKQKILTIISHIIFKLHDEIIGSGNQNYRSITESQQKDMNNLMLPPIDERLMNNERLKNGLLMLENSMLTKRKYSDRENNEQLRQNNLITILLINKDEIPGTQLNTDNLLNNLVPSTLLSSITRNELYKRISIEELDDMSEEDIQNLFNRKISILKELLIIRRNEAFDSDKLPALIKISCLRLRRSFNDNPNNDGNHNVYRQKVLTLISHMSCRLHPDTMGSSRQNEGYNNRPIPKNKQKEINNFQEELISCYDPNPQNPTQKIVHSNIVLDLQPVHQTIKHIHYFTSKKYINISSSE
jgi:hypothetical protein